MKLLDKIIDLIPDPKEVKINIADAKKEYQEITEEFGVVLNKLNELMEKPNIEDIDRIIILTEEKGRLLGKSEQIRKYVGIWLK